nr:hypothetical protein [Synechococcus sp. MU1643]
MDLASASTVLTTSLSTSIPANESVLVLNRTTRSLVRTGDPIWSLRLETPGQPVQRFDAVSSRAHRQNADRNRSGTRAPLSAGRYRLGPMEPLGPSDPRELGPIWIGIEPQFPTGRGHLGIHLDPSANRNANSGTLGRVGLICWDDMQTLAGLVQHRNVRTLVVSE